MTINTHMQINNWIC